MKKFVLLPVVIPGLLALVTTAHAAGIGLYGAGGTPMINWKYNRTDFGSTTDHCYGGGLVVDSAVAKDTLFNYRFTAGYERYGSDNRFLFTEPGSKTAHKFDMCHSFGFGLVRTEAMRFWVGPQIGAHYIHSSDFPHDRYAIIPYYYLPGTGLVYSVGGLLPAPHTKKASAIGVDVLLALGVNFNIGELVTLFAEIGRAHV